MASGGPIGIALIVSSEALSGYSRSSFYLLSTIVSILSPIFNNDSFEFSPSLACVSAA